MNEIWDVIKQLAQRAPELVIFGGTVVVGLRHLSKQQAENMALIKTLFNEQTSAHRESRLVIERNSEALTAHAVATERSTAAVNELTNLTRAMLIKGAA